jgi:hypothetical protein
MAVHSVWHHLVTQKPKLKHYCKLNDLRAGFEITEGYKIGHGPDANFQDAVEQDDLF